MCSLWGAITSDGFLETDSITHYLYARFAIAEPHYLVNIWGRPLCTGLYTVPAYLFGRLGVRITSLLLAVLCSLVTAEIARRRGDRHPAVAMICVLAQPLLFLHSFSELTELPFAACLSLALLAWQCRSYAWMALLCGLLPLGRPEGFGLAMLAGAVLLWQRRWKCVPLLAAPVVVWSFAGWLLYGSPRYSDFLPGWLQWVLWLPRNWPYSSTSLYQPGHPMKFVGALPAIVGPLLFPATLIGTWLCLRSRDHFARATALVPLLVLAVHSWLHWRGMLASSGEIRYLLAVAPFWGLLSSAGWEWLAERLEWKRPVAIAGVAALIPALVNFQQTVGSGTVGYKVLPLKMHQDMLDARTLAEWYRSWDRRADYPRIMAAHPGVFYFLDQSPTAVDRSVEFSRDAVARAPDGTLMIWDEIYSVFNSDESRSVSLEAVRLAGWKIVPTERWVIAFSPRDALGEPTRDLPTPPLK